MGQSLSNVLVHLVFSTKNRAPLLSDLWRPDFHDYLCGIVRRLNGKVLAINSVEDHVHVFLPLPRTCTISDLMQAIKGSSAKWINEKYPGQILFRWQGGYGAFSVSPSHRKAVIEYVERQQEHHKQVSFQDEFRRLLTVYGVEYDEAYVWD